MKAEITKCEFKISLNDNSYFAVDQQGLFFHPRPGACRYFSWQCLADLIVPTLPKCCSQCHVELRKTEEDVCSDCAMLQEVDAEAGTSSCEPEVERVLP